jgi:hypothetical protein
MIVAEQNVIAVLASDIMPGFAGLSRVAIARPLVTAKGLRY